MNPSTNYDQPLVIIDMQNFFFKRNKSEMDVIKERVKKVCKLCKLWIQRGLPIVLVEYNLDDERLEKPSDDRTVYPIRRIIKNYPHVTRVEKKRDDGSKDLLAEFAHMHVDPKELHICGVNLAYCVADTLHGLFHRKNNVKVKLYKEISFNVHSPNHADWHKSCFDDIQSCASNYNASLEVCECPIPA